MMKKILFTGGNGFIGSNILPTLRKKYDVFSPNRMELNLFDINEVREYLAKNNFYAVLHCANPNPVKNPCQDSLERMFEDSLRMFMNLYDCSELYTKMIYTGSGAEYDKMKEIKAVKESDCFHSMPSDIYGLSKYIMNKLTQMSDNIYNLCIFGCYGPHDHQTKFITHCINSCLKGKPITIRQECRFDFIHVYDLARMMEWMIENEMKFHMYNASGGFPCFLSEIAREVRRQMHSKGQIRILKEGLNLEYTADGSRFYTESGLTPQISIKDGIAMQIAWQSNGREL